MDSGRDTPKGVGFPIRRSADQRSLASPRGLSQRATSFIAFWRQGIHRTPFSCSTSKLPFPEAPTNARTQDISTLRGQPGGPQHSFTETLACRNAFRRLRKRQALRLQHQIRFTMPNNTGMSRTRLGARNGFSGSLHLCSKRPFEAIPCRTENSFCARGHDTSGDGRIRTDGPLLAKQVLSH